MIVSDNGAELTSRAILEWQEDRRVEWHHIAPGKPMQNGFVVSLNGRFLRNRPPCVQRYTSSDQLSARPNRCAGDMMTIIHDVMRGLDGRSRSTSA